MTGSTKAAATNGDLCIYQVPPLTLMKVGPDVTQDSSTADTAQGFSLPATPATSLPGFLKVPEAAAHAKVSSWAIRNEIASGRLHATRIGRTLRILDEDLAVWARGGCERSSNGAT